MNINEATAVTDELVAAFERLVPQLNSAAQLSPREQLEKVVSARNSSLLLARDDDDTIIGTLTLVWYDIPTARRIWIEDVVVDEAARGQGVGEKLVRAALERVKQLGGQQVDLTSRPMREAANRLYQRLGFERRETNYYRYTFEKC